MNINKEQIDEVNVVLSMEVNHGDYESKVNEILRDYRRKANMPGFRPGKVPEGLIRKMYGKAVLIDELNKLVSESLQNYIKENDLHLIGDPLPKVSGDDMEWEIGNDFTFDFEVGMAPVIDVQLSKDDHITKYQITVDQNMIDEEIEQLTTRYGQFVDTDTVVDFKERLTGDIVQLDNDGQPLQDGLSAEDTLLMIQLIKTDESQKPFVDAKVGDEIVFNLSETFPEDWSIASILKKKNKDEVGDVSGSLFRFTVKTVQKFAKAELSQELFDKILGKDAVSNIEDFESQIEKDMAANFEARSMAKFGNDAREYLLEKFNPSLPEEHLHKSVLAANKEISMDTLEKGFPHFLKSMKWDLIVKAISKKFELSVTEDEIISLAKDAVRQQIAYYGMSDVSDETITQYAMNSLKEEKQIHETAAQVLEKKVVQVLSEVVGLNIQQISLNDFNKMIAPPNDEEIENNEEIEESKEIETIVEVEEGKEIETILEVEESQEIKESE